MESPRDTASWITNLAQRSDEIRETALARLIERGILEAAPGGEVFLSAGVSRSCRYSRGREDHRGSTTPYHADAVQR